MSLFVECFADETSAVSVGFPKREIEHSLSRAGVCTQLSRRKSVTGMMDEDPGWAVQPYLRSLVEESWEHGIRVLIDKEEGNRAVILSPRLEEWLVQCAKSAGLK